LMYKDRFCGKTGPRTVFTIDAKCGYKIELFSFFGEEEGEVLFPPLALLAVMHSSKQCDPQCIVDKDAGMADQIIMKQVMPSSVASASGDGDSGTSPPSWFGRVAVLVAVLAILAAVMFANGSSSATPFAPAAASPPVDVNPINKGDDTDQKLEAKEVIAKMEAEKEAEKKQWIAEGKNEAEREAKAEKEVIAKMEAEKEAEKKQWIAEGKNEAEKKTKEVEAWNAIVDERERKIVADAISKIKGGATHLSLLHNQIGDEGAKAIAAVLAGSSLTWLHLGYNQITGGGILSALFGPSGVRGELVGAWKAKPGRSWGLSLYGS
jgi:hypothetical protein